MQLVLVYNANAGIAAALFDTLHKYVSPATYQCSLCAVTYGPLAMHARWRDYLRALPYPVQFYHRPDFRAAFPDTAAIELPLIACERNGSIVPLLNAAELRALTRLDDLMAALDQRIAGYADKA